MNYFLHEANETSLDLRLLKDNLENLDKMHNKNNNIKNKTLKKQKKSIKKTLRNL